VTFSVAFAIYAKAAAARITPTAMPRQFRIGAFSRLRVAGWSAASTPSLTNIAAIAHSEARLAPSTIYSAMPSFCSGRIATKTASAPLLIAILPPMARVRSVQARPSPATSSGNAVIARASRAAERSRTDAPSSRAAEFRHHAARAGPRQTSVIGTACAMIRLLRPGMRNFLPTGLSRTGGFTLLCRYRVENRVATLKGPANGPSAAIGALRTAWRL